MKPSTRAHPNPLFRNLPRMACAVLFAASLPPATAQDEEQEELFELSAFEVSVGQDDGYRLTHTTAGTRIDEEIRNIPIAIQSISREFLDDSAAFDLRDATQYSAGIQAQGVSNVEQGGLDSDRESNYKIRGMITANSLRDGNWRFYRTDGTIIERVEVVRGPSALLYGIGSFNGIINTLTKKPLFKSETTVDARAGSQGFYRGEVDRQGLAGEHGAYRVALAHMNYDHWIDNQDTRSTVLFTAFRYRPNRRTLIDFSHEYFDDLRRPAHRMLEERNPNLADELGFVAVPDIRTFSWNSPQNQRDNRLHETTLAVTREFGRATVRFTYVRSDLQMTRFGHGVALHPNATDNLDRIPRDGATEPSGRFRNTVPAELRRVDGNVLKAIPHLRNENVLVDQFRLEWTRVFDTQRGNHRLLFGAHYLPDYETYVRHGLAYDFENEHLRAFYKRPDDFTPFLFPDDLQYNAELNHRSNFNDDLGLYMVHIGNFLNNRLFTIVGLRYDRSSSTRHTYHDNGSLKTSVGDDGRDLGTTFDHWTPQFGLNYKVNNQLSVYATTAGGLNPNYSPTDGDGNQFDPTTSRGLEAGMKADFFSEKLSGTAAFFHTERKGSVYNDRTAFNNEPDSGGYSTFITVDDRAYGIDMQWHWRPVRGFDMLLTYAWTDTKLTDVSPYVTPTLVGTNVDEDGNPIPHARGLASSDYLRGQQLNDTPRHAATLWTRYTFREGKLRRLNLGLGLVYMGTRTYQTRYTFAAEATPIAKMPETYQVDALIRYPIRMGNRKDLDLRLNVKNLFDSQKLIGDRFENPRRIILSGKLSF